MSANYQEIKEYLLGKLDAPDYERVDLQLIEDEEYAADALAAEDRLIEEYIDGELTDADAELFRANYLTTEARGERLKQFAALRAAAVRHSARLAPLREPQAEEPGFWDLLRGFRPAMGFAAIGLVVAAGVGIWMIFADGTRASLEREYAALNSTDMTDLTKFGAYTAHEVIPGTLRSTDTAAKLNLLESSKTILFRLPLAFEPPPDAVYSANLSNNGRSVFTLSEIRLVKNGAMHEARILLPRQLIKKGQNQITLEAVGAGTTPITYTFTADEFATVER